MMMDRYCALLVVYIQGHFIWQLMPTVHSYHFLWWPAVQQLLLFHFPLIWGPHSWIQCVAGDIRFL